MYGVNYQRDILNFNLKMSLHIGLFQIKSIPPRFGF